MRVLLYEVTWLGSQGGYLTRGFTVDLCIIGYNIASHGEHYKQNYSYYSYMPMV